MTALEIVAVLVALGLLGLMVWATSRAAALRRKDQDSADAGSCWRTDFSDGDGGGD